MSVTKTATSGKRAAIYPRVSTGLQEQNGTSLDTQDQRCRQYATEHGYTVDESHVYREVHTGVELWERPQLTRLREAIRAGQVDVLVAYSVDRLSRDPAHLGVILSEAEHAGVTVEFVTEVLDNSPEGQLLRFIKGYVGKIEHEKIKERTMRGKIAKVRAGKPMPGCRARYGYLWADDRKTQLVVNPRQALVVKRIFADFLAGQTSRAIAIALSNEGVPSPTGRKPYWRHTVVDNVLRERTYAGQLVAFRTVTLKEDGRKVLRERPDGGTLLPEGLVPPLVSLEDFCAVQEMLTRRKERSPRNNRDPEASLLRGGYVKCGYCGHTIAVGRRGDGSSGKLDYQCPNSVNPATKCPGKPSLHVPILDAAVWARVRQVLTRPDIIAQELERLREQDPGVVNLAAIDEQIGKLQAKRDRLTRRLAMIEDDELAQSVVRDAEALSQEIRSLQADREAITRRRTEWQKVQTNLESLRAWCRKVADKVDSLTYAEKRLALDALAVQVTLWRADHERRYDIDMTVDLDSEIVSTTSLTTGTTTPGCAGSVWGITTRSAMPTPGTPGAWP